MQFAGQPKPCEFQANIEVLQNNLFQTEKSIFNTFLFQLNEDEALIGCVHFHKEIYNTHGIPTLVKVKTGESFANIRDRIQSYLEISQETFDKYKVAVIFNGQVGIESVFQFKYLTFIIFY